MDASSSLMGGPASADAPTDGEHRMDTTIVGVCYDGGVVLAADSRTSTGMYVANRASDKISQLTDNVYVCRSGSGQQVLRPIHSRKMVKIEHCDEGDATSAGASAPRSGTIDPQQLDPTLVVVKAEEVLVQSSKIEVPIGILQKEASQPRAD
ncbi:Proteasome subunit beta type-6 [Hordeum vulgare]|nr:Proteasome subunit beta type-6 [Hordeum vulgare]